MKKLTLGFIALSLIATSAFASDTARLNLSGTVDSNILLDISGQQDKNVTVDVINGMTRTEVGLANSTSNHNAGYTIKSTPTYGKLRHTTSSTLVEYDYEIYYGGQKLAKTANEEVLRVDEITKKSTVTKPIELEFAAQADAPSGSYAETITFTIQAN